MESVLEYVCFNRSKWSPKMMPQFGDIEKSPYICTYDLKRSVALLGSNRTRDRIIDIHYARPLVMGGLFCIVVSSMPPKNH